MFNCDKCVASFSRRCNLNRHLKMHDGFGFKCSLCDKLFTRKDNLSRHTKAFHSGKEVHLFMNADVNGSKNDTPTNAMWDDTENNVVCNDLYDAARVDVIPTDNIKIAPLAIVPNIPAGASKSGSTKRNIDKLKKNIMPYIKANNELSVLQKNEFMAKIDDEDYKDKIKNNLSWIKVVSYLINLIKNKNEEQQKIILKDIMDRWHIIRDNHVGHFKKQEKTLRTYSAAKKPKLHVYMEQLSFPKKNRELRNTTSSFEDFHITISEAKSYNINETEAEQNLSSYTDDKIRYHEVVKNSSTLSKRPKNKHKNFSVEESQVNFLKNHNNMKKTSEEEDDDLEFFYSILPTVKSLTSDQKFSFRIRTMQFLYNIINISSINQSIKKSSVTSSIAAYYSEFFPDEISNDNNVCLQENYNDQVDKKIV